MLAILATLGLLATAEPVMITVAPGEVLAVTVNDAAGERPVLLIPGLSGCTYGYRKVIPGLLADGLPTIAVEPLGLGFSGRPRDADYTLTAQAARIAAVCDSLSLRGAVVVSQGVATGMALRLALARPDLVAGIVSIEGGAAESAATPTVRNTLKVAKLVTSFGGGEIIRDRYTADLKKSSGDPSWVDRGTVRQYQRGLGRDLQATLDVFLAMAEQAEPVAIVPHLREITVPVRVLRGTAEHHGSLDPENVAELTAGLPDVRIIDVPGGGHFLQEEKPQVVVDAVSALVAELRASVGESR